MKLTGKLILMISAVASLLVACGKEDNNGYGGGQNGGDAGVYATLPQPAEQCITGHPIPQQQWPQTQWGPQYMSYGFQPYQQGYSHYGYNQPNAASSYYGAGYPNMGSPFFPQFPGQGSPYPYHQVTGNYNSGIFSPTNGFCGCGGNQIPVCNRDYGMQCLQSRYIPNQPYAVWNYNDQRNSFYFNGSWGRNNINQYGCSAGFAQACAVNMPNSCGYGALCVATVPNAPVGICVRR